MAKAPLTLSRQVIGASSEDFAADGFEGRGSAGPPPSVQAQRQLSMVAYAGYSFIAFWAFWFGAARFDVDGDGDFDPEDIEVHLENTGWLRKNFEHTRTSRIRRETVLRDRRRRADQQRRQCARRARAEGRPAPRSDTEIFELFGVKIDDCSEEHVTDTFFFGERQNFPFFVILQTLLMVGLWLAYAVKAYIEDKVDVSTYDAGLDSIWPGRTGM